MRDLNICKHASEASVAVFVTVCGGWVLRSARELYYLTVLKTVRAGGIKSERRHRALDEQDRVRGVLAFKSRV